MANNNYVDPKRIGSEFYATKLTFRASLGSDSFLFEEWEALPDSLKSAALYLNFYNQITLAWDKCKSFYTEDQAGVECVMQYLEKNVPIILESPQKYNPRYIYRVAYNCMYCICHDIKRDRERYENECSNIVEHDGEQLDLFDTATSNKDIYSELVARDTKAKFWAMIEDMDVDSQTIIDEFLYNKNPSKKINAETRAEILKNLRSVFKPFLNAYFG